MFYFKGGSKMQGLNISELVTVADEVITVKRIKHGDN